jgi:exopolyphosphatase/pppGpp-phosphohydrolase
MEALYAAALEILRDAPVANPAELVAVGGTASNLLKVVPAAASDGVLTRKRIVEAQVLLASMPATTATDQFGLNPVRARLMPAGAAIMAALLDRYGANQVRVSDAGLREGTILAVMHVGPAWRDRLFALAHGWRT